MRTILAGASGGTSSNGAIGLACQLAIRFQAHVECLHIRPDPGELSLASATGYGMPLPIDWVEQFEADADAAAAKVKDNFLSAVTAYGLPTASKPQRGASACWREGKGHPAETLSRWARFFDLIVLGRSERVIEQPHTDAIEKTLLHAGRPVLLAPARAPEHFGETIAIGWNGSPGAVRAIEASLPLVRQAGTVVIISVGPKHRHSAPGIQEYLAWHGVNAKLREITVVEGVGAGAQLLSAARDDGADLLVMGAYSHAPWREALLGSATREIVDTSLLPVMITH
jgi:nucleotide-binding universal stress UspA family protein